MKPNFFFFSFYLILFFVNIHAQNDTISINKNLKVAKELRFTEPKKADSLYQKIIEHAKQVNFKMGEYDAYLNLAYVWFYSNEYDKAIIYGEQSLKIAKQLNYNKGIGTSYANLGTMFTHTSEYSKATEKYILAMPYLTTLNDTIALITINQNLGMIFMDLKQYTKAEEYSKVGLKLSKEANIKAKIAAIGLNLGLLYLNQKQPNEAFNQLKEIEPLVIELNNPQTKYHLAKNLSEYYLNYAEDYTNSLKYALEAYDNLHNTNLENEMSYCLNLLGDIYFKIGNFDNSEYYNLKSYELAKKINLNGTQRNVLLSLSELYAKKQNYRRAYNYAEKFIKLNDSILSQESNQIISNLTIQYETKKKDNEIALQKLQLQEQENDILKKKNQYNIALGSGIFFLLGSIGLWLFYRQRQKLKNNEILALQTQQEVLKLEALIDGEEKERNRLAQDLHDGINGDLAVIKYKISSIEPNKFSKKEKIFYDDAISMLDNAVEQVRRISHNLAPPSLHNFDLVEAIQQFCSKQNASNSLNISFQYFGNRLSLKSENETAIYRIIQELIHNVIKHANATEALVQLNNHEDKLIITVEDNGQGFDTNSSENGIGLQNIKSRVNFLKANLDISSSKKGTTFSIEIDLNKIKKK
ncbi:tetratricopeptide repeat-containing sensor histidine kinase [Yeosuana marina]|uniref:tetratricopeptide repeat-containing sensor histidine kinase n=1 Tax=Yeosuana marina TaxID=1565536 RepID=UPI00142218E2|nr:sensor histidine kinase [Yeosuana marina]